MNQFLRYAALMFGLSTMIGEGRSKIECQNTMFLDEMSPGGRLPGIRN